MRMDHVSYASEHDGLAATTERIASALGVEAVKGGVHPRFGTRNMIIPLSGHKYLEGWCVEVDDLAPFEERLGRAAVNGNRKFPDGRELVWKQIGILGLIADPQVPYMLKWEGDPELHPSNAYPSNVKMSALTIAGSAERVTEWLGVPVEKPLEDVAVNWLAPRGTPGILSVTFETATGAVTI
jgi:hypothetical protein